MKVIIAGSRTFNNYELLCESLKDINISEIVCGGARGADSLGEKYAKEHNIPIKYFYPQWDLLGKKAGMIRNQEMGSYADFLVAFWDGESKGTKHMIEYMKRINKHGKVVIFNG